MSHPEQLGYFEAVSRANRHLIEGGRVLEIGAYDVNGNTRSHFTGAADYVGVDLTPGPNVDLVAYGHEVDHPDGSYDLTLSGECFEHDPHWRDTFTNMARLTRPGGLVIATCASRGRPEHGTSRTLVSDSPGTQSEGLDYYRNLTPRDLEEALPLGELFESYRIWYLPTHFDLYFAGIRAGEAGTGPRGVLPTDADIEALGALMSLPQRLIRTPLRAALKATRSPEQYQNVVLPYWLGMLRVQQLVESKTGRTVGSRTR